MLKFILALIILGPAVHCRFAPEDRQWQPDDNKQHCIEQCDKDCEYCDPKTCSDDEEYCGTGDSNVHPNCPPDEVCVPPGCKCKYIFFISNIYTHICY